MAEERISGIEGVLGDIANAMGKKLDEHSRQIAGVNHTLAEHSRTLAFHGQQLTELSRKLDDQDIALYNLSAIMQQHSRDIRGIKTELSTVNGKLDQVIALLTQKPE